MKTELEILEQIGHPYIVRVLDLFEDDENIYVAQELLPEGNLQQFLRRVSAKRRTFREKDAANMVWQIMLAVRYVHEAGMIHRDLKMENIMVDMTPQGDGTSDIVCKLTDFGFACVMEPGSNINLVLGTPYYMAPEMVEHENYD